MFRRLFYLFYYIKETDIKQFKVNLLFASSKSGKSKLRILTDTLISVFKYNISLKDYFCFRFFELTKSERFKWAGTGFMYEYQLRMNPKRYRNLLIDKIKFLHLYRPFIKREFHNLDELKSNHQLADKMLAYTSGRIVLKNSKGQIGAEVEVISCDKYTPTTLISYMTRKKYNLVEEYIVQHPALMALSPSGLNTIRIFTQLHSGRVDILGARLRITVNSMVDNMAAGNLASPVDIETGIVTGPGVYSDITKKDQEMHPVTGKSIIGFSIPFWKEVIELAKSAALYNNENKSVGWDIAVTSKGPELIEGNHNWCKNLWQLPVKKGLRKELEKYL